MVAIEDKQIEKIVNNALSNGLSESALYEIYTKLKEASKFYGLVLVDEYYGFFGDENKIYDTYRAYYFSGDANVVLDDEGYYELLESYVNEKWIYTTKVYRVTKEIPLYEYEKVFDENNLELIWERDSKSKTKFEYKSEKLIQDYEFDYLDKEIQKCYNRITEIQNLIDTIRNTR